MVGTIRTLDEDMKQTIIKRMHEMVPQIAEAFDGSAEVSIKKLLR